jgi:hypothetical protein
MRTRAPLATLLLAVSMLAASMLSVSACEPPPPSLGEGEGEGEGEACTPVTLGPVAFNFRDDVSTHFQWPVLSPLDTAAPDFLVLQLFNYNERIGPLGVGTFPLDDAINDNYGHCAECLLLLTDQLTPTSQPQRVFFQSAGTITVEENPREVSRLRGQIAGLRLVESTIGGDALESAPVPGGECLDLGTITFDLKIVPTGWTCDEALFADGSVCHCGCGADDEDCFPAEGPAPAPVGCGEGEVCDFGGACRATCDVVAGVGCDNALCVFRDPVDVCVGLDSFEANADTAAIGEVCDDDTASAYCAVQGTVPRGMCDFDADLDGVRFCKPVCDDDSDCADGDVCQAMAGFDGGTLRGFCDVPIAP